jgi:hypothetical protein
MGMTDYVSESFHDLFTGESEAISDSNSSGGSHHPSSECFVADPTKVHVESTHDGNTPLDASDGKAQERNQAPPRLRLEQLWERKKELEEARLQLEQEHAKLEREIGRRGDGRRAYANARDVNRRILEDDEGPPLFARASQNVTATAALLEGLLKPAVPEAHRAHHKLRTLLERAAPQQAESSMSQRCGPNAGCQGELDAGCQGCVRPPSPTRGRRSRERPCSGMPQRRPRRAPHSQCPQAWERG